MNQTVTHLYQTCRTVSLFHFITTGVLGVPPGSVTEGDFLRMTFDVPHYFEKEVTWLMGNYLDYVNKEAIGKDRVLIAESDGVAGGPQEQEGGHVAAFLT